MNNIFETFYYQPACIYIPYFLLFLFACVIVVIVDCFYIIFLYANILFWPLFFVTLIFICGYCVPFLFIGIGQCFGEIGAWIGLFIGVIFSVITFFLYIWMVPRAYFE